MICPTCGTENRPGTRFCAQCGAPLEEEATPQPSAPQPSAAVPRSPSHATGSPADTVQVASKIGLFGGHGLVTLGALVVLFAFMLPWASCGNLQLSGLDIVTQSSKYAEYGGDASWAILALVPLGALASLVLSIVSLAVNLLGKRLSATLSRLGLFLPLVAALPGLCGCCPSCAFFLNMQSARSDPDSLGLGMLVQIEYGFWLTLFGLGVSFVGMVAALAGGLVAQRRAASGGSSSS